MKGRSKKKNRSILDLQVVTLIIASILLGVLIYTNSGYIGEHLSPILGGIMGWIKYIIPIGTYAIAIFLASDEDKELNDGGIVTAYANEYNPAAVVVENQRQSVVIDFQKKDAERHFEKLDKIASLARKNNKKIINKLRKVVN